MIFNPARRDVLKAAAGAATGLSLGSGLRPAAAQTKTLRVTHFGGPYQALAGIAGKPFEAAAHAKVEYSVEISPTSLSKMQTERSDPPFDVTLLSRAYGLRAMNAGLLARVSASDFPQAAQTIPNTIPAAGWGVAMVLDTMDIMVDTKQVSNPLTSWLDLWRPDLQGKLLLPATVNGSAATAFIACIIRAIGGDLKSPAAAEEAFRRLKELKSSVRGFYADGIQPNQMIERGDIAVAPQYAIRIANTTRTLPNVVKATPKEGVLAVPYDLCIPKNTPDAALAKSYIDFTLTEPVQSALVAKLLATPVRLGTPVPAVLQPMVNTDPDRIWFQDEAFAASKQREWLDRYTREVQS